jgi:hypothetical protein
LEYYVYVAGRTVDVFCKALKDSNLLKKMANCFGLAAEWFRHLEMPVSPTFGNLAKEMMVAKIIIGAAEVYTKWEPVVKPLRDRTVFVQGNLAGSQVDAHGALQNGVQADDAPAWEKVAKKAAQVSDWVFSLSDFSHYVMNSGVVEFAKETAQSVRFGLNTAITVAGFTLSGFSLWEEGHKLYHGNIVRADPALRNGLVQHADGFVWKMTWEDQVHSWIKIAMSVAYLVLSIYGAFALFGVLLPYAAVAKTAALSVATLTALANHFWERIAIDSLGRAQQRPIV